jgi:hypothetical protein
MLAGMQWEYVVHTLNVTGFFTSGHVNPQELQHVLNHYGYQGWELATSFDTSSGQGGSRLVVLTFKRPLVAPVVPPPVPTR